MFLGEFRPTLDEKGRLAVPSRYRDELGEQFVITRGLDTCVFVYPQTEWTAIETRLRTMPQNSFETRAFLRTFFSGASELTCDKQGRVVIPANLREYAQLDKDCVFIGVGNHAEIWSAPVWEEYSKTNAESFSQQAATLGDLFL